MKRFLIERANFRRCWSVWAGVVVTTIFTAVPVIADHWPELVPGFIALFPKHGKQWAPLIGVALIVAARVISQAAIVDAVRRAFKRRREREPLGDSDESA